MINGIVVSILSSKQAIPENPKKRRTELDTNNDEKMPSSKEVEAEDVETNNYMGDDTKGADGDLYYGNEEEMYGYDDGNYDYDGF
ncbi:hypothetical protein NL676_017118 [Syzygium grande]|nr:hypothetical protein NL676_017118 [Syzygium grande]